MSAPASSRTAKAAVKPPPEAPFPMSHEFCRDHLGQYLDQSLDAIEREKVESHLQSCADCTQIAREMAGIRAAMRDMTPFAAPPQLRPNVRAALQNQRIKSAARPRFGLRLPQLAWSGSLALGALTLLVLARPFAHQPITLDEPSQPPNSASGAAQGKSSAASSPNRAANPNPKTPQATKKTPTASTANRSNNPTGAAPPSTRNDEAGATPKTPSATGNGKAAIEKGSVSTHAAAVVPLEQLQPDPSPARAAIRLRQITPSPVVPHPVAPNPVVPNPVVPNPRFGAEKPKPMRPAPATSPAPASALPSISVPGSAVPASPEIASQKRQVREPQFSRARVAAPRRAATAIPSAAGSPGLPQKAASTTRGQLPAPLFSLQLRAAPSPLVAPSAAPADTVSNSAATNSAATNLAATNSAPSNAAPPRADITRSASPLAVAGAMSSGAAASGGMSLGAARERDEAGRLDASGHNGNALIKAAPPRGFAGGRGGLPAASNAPKIAASEARDEAQRQASYLRAVRRFNLQVRAARAQKNARVRVEVAAPARLLWPQSGVVWSGDLVAGTPVEIEFSLGGLRGGEIISVVLEQKMAGAPSRIVETQTLVVPPAP